MSKPNYLFEAFKMKGNLFGLGIGVIIAAIFSSAFVFGAVVGAEAFFLLGMSTNHRFQRAIRARQR